MSENSVPDYRSEIRRNATSNKSVVFIFAFNEGEKLRKQLERFPKPQERAYDIMIGNDGSTDGSISSNLLESFDIRGCTHLEQNMGLSPNIKAGLHWFLTQSNYKSIIMMNGNNKDNPSSIPQFLNELEQGLDYVQGSRFISGGHQENTPLIRHFAIRMIHAPLFSLAAHRWMTDTTNGYRAFSRSFLQDARVHLFQEAFQAYEIEQYMAWKALRLGFECKEISVSRCYPPRNQQKSTASFSKIKPGSGYFLMIKPLLCLNLGLYK